MEVEGNYDGAVNPVITQGKSTISKLSIRGIRSFDPGHEEAIEFYSPLTMILGANGCGKTTVIEALKYATTGSLPPGARAGHSFVNDPGMTDSSEVKAQIKLRFNNNAGEVNVISRSLQLTKKKVKMEFKALDGLLRMKSRDDNKYSSISMKCAELDKMVPELLGVSPPIIENVILTHQEDSSWPMADGATLKKKFDDIFESTRYTRALEAFQKSKKEFAAKAKDLKAEMMELGAHLQSVKTDKHSLSECEERQEECSLQVSELSDKIENVQSRVDTYKAEKEQLEQRYREVDQLTLKIDELSNRICMMNEKDSELRVCTVDLEHVNNKIASSRQANDKLMLSKGTIDSLQSALSNLEGKYQTQACHLQRKFDIPKVIPDTAHNEAWRYDSASLNKQQMEADLTKAREDYNDAEKQLKELQDPQDIPGSQFAMSGISKSREELEKVSRQYNDDEQMLASLSAQHHELIAKESSVEQAKLDVADEKKANMPSNTGEQAVPASPDELAAKLQILSRRSAEVINETKVQASELSKLQADLSGEQALFSEGKQRVESLKSQNQNVMKCHEQFTSIRHDFLNFIDEDIRNHNILEMDSKFGNKTHSEKVAMMSTPELFSPFLEKAAKRANSNKCPCCDQTISVEIKQRCGVSAFEKQLNAMLKDFKTLLAPMQQAGQTLHEIHELESKDFGAVISRLQDFKLSWQSKNDQLEEKIRDKDRITASYGRSYGSRTIEQIQQVQSERLKIKERAQKEKDDFAEQERELDRKFFALKNNLSDKHSVLLHLQKECAMLEDYEGAVERDKKACDELDKVIRSIKSTKDDIARDFEDVNLEVSEKKIELENCELQGRASLEDIRTAQQQLMALEENKAAIEPRIKKISSELQQQETTRRTIRENLEVRTLRKKKQDVKDQLKAATSNAVERDIQRLEQQQYKYNAEVFKCKGRLEVLEQQAGEINAKLKTPLYRNIEERHRQKCIQFETTELAVKDLDAYYNALDQALQSFHTLKIKEINKIIRELWQLIYKGQDIDMIELESGVDKESSARTTRSYNYRTFCLNCGILALDEPTTNLDEANRNGLAHALARIIISRQRQQNFQLICITHDEEFVKLMNNELAASSEFSMPEYYFKVSREESSEGKGMYFSKIERIPWGDL
eukprot:GSChrysophyteH1.ASY1.ANO1.2096.1 assembled CDS